MRVGFTGTRRGMTPGQLAAVSFLLRAWSRVAILEVHHGGCRGADLEFHALARPHRRHVHPGPGSSRSGDVVYPVPCHGSGGRGSPYLVRNRDIVDACEVLVAAPGGPEVVRSGTWATIRYARRVGRPVVLLRP